MNEEKEKLLQLGNLVSRGVPMAEARKRLGLATSEATKEPAAEVTSPSETTAVPEAQAKPWSGNTAKKGKK